MLPRVIGEHIETTTSLAPDLPPRQGGSEPDGAGARQPRPQRPRRDAGGRTSDDRDGERDARRATARGRAPSRSSPGSYVMLAVTDTGSGHGRRHARARLRAVLHDEAEGQGHGPRPRRRSTASSTRAAAAIALDTAPGRGTSVRIYLPVTSATEERSRAARDCAGNAQRRGTETLLLVEDNDSVRELAVQALRRRGYTVHEARNAEEAIEWSLNSRVKPHLARDRRRHAGPQRAEPRRAPAAAEPAAEGALHVGLHRRRDRGARQRSGAACRCCRNRSRPRSSPSACAWRSTHRSADAQS